MEAGGARVEPLGPKLSGQLLGATTGSLERERSVGVSSPSASSQVRLARDLGEEKEQREVVGLQSLGAGR